MAEIEGSISSLRTEVTGMGSGIKNLKLNFEELQAEKLVNRVNDLRTDITSTDTSNGNLQQTLRANTESAEKILTIVDKPSPSCKNCLYDETVTFPGIKKAILCH